MHFLSNKLVLKEMCYSVSNTGILGKRKPECSYQELNLQHKTFGLLVQGPVA